MAEKSGDTKPPRPRATRTAVTREIDENLKRVYQSDLPEEVPDRFTKLLEQLRAKDGNK